MDINNNSYQSFLKRTVDEAKSIPDLVYAVTFSDPETAEEKILWVKKATPPQDTKWHNIQTKIAKFIPLEILRPTVSKGGMESLHGEKNRMLAFAQNGITVPSLVFSSDALIITENLGENLEQKLCGLETEEEKYFLIEKAAQALVTVHQKNLCHGRPHLKDFVITKGEIGFLDFEEDPLSVMSLSHAQARDIWLFVLSAAKFLDKDRLKNITVILRQEASHDTSKELGKFVRFLRPLRKFVSLIGAPGKDTKKAVKTNLVFEEIL